MGRVHERKQVQNHVQRAPGRLAFGALNLGFSLGGEGQKERRWGGGGIQDKEHGGLGKSLNPYHQLEVVGWSDRAGLLDERISSMPDTPLR